MYDRWNLVLADFLINLAAGWFGAVFITPNYSKKKRNEKLFILIINSTLAILCLVGANLLRWQN